MRFINSNIIRFHGKSRKGSEDVAIREQILTLQNLYQTYRKNLNALGKDQGLQGTNELELLKANMKNIEDHIEKLMNLIN